MAHHPFDAEFSFPGESLVRPVSSKSVGLAHLLQIGEQIAEKARGWEESTRCSVNSNGWNSAVRAAARQRDRGLKPP
jgi:hypothetical protein